ncbi:FtsK/SpoIIIE family DNA translocase [Lacrimispora sphenoides]|uniref:DNA segregation ATPase FtsK/SpoIIIE, S-DNA-T family n=1 Tax=Lacrimispora sphenoides JCM 1415 TaxID=1297793 RepID=A0ABY1C790_9FIRM|nr:DNA translocase FtsK [Lacrimispora sphenoides]SET75961.1 DNA segregation ATPase FtsK/SpoIIIE, S-DNA-T family [[Clostridium] sphenoides JCM 1415]SUY51048.1 cell division protein FtsK [Lacrimispora sphenoides]
MPETTKKRTTAKKGKNGRTRNTAAKKNVILPEPEFIHSEVVIIMSFLAAAILFFSNFHLCGVVGDFLRSLQLGIFGSVGYVAPVLLFAGTAFYISNQGNPRAAFKLASFILALVSLCGFLQLLFGAKAGEGIGLADIYFEASVSGIGGGIIGGLLAGGLASIIGVVGAYLVIGVLLVISLVCITEKSFVDIVKKGSGKAYRHARENMDMHMEVHAMRQEARKQLLEEKKLRGVNLEATKLEEAQEESYVEEQVEEAPDNLADDIMVQAKRLSAVTAVEEDELNPADIFRGSFSPVLEDDEDSVPFAPDVQGTPFAEALEEPSIYMKKEIKTLKELEFVEEDFYPEEGNDTFAIPEEPKQVVTASGKVIETDTEALQKKLEKKREEAAKEDGGSVSLEIKQKQEIVKQEYKFPPLSLLKKGKSAVFSDREYKDTAIKLQRTLQNFGVGVTVTNISCGPSVTRYELHPEQGVKVSKIVSLADDIKLSLAAADIRIEAPIPGKSAVGIEVPNKENQMVYLRDILEADSFQKHSSKIAFAVGKDIGGQVVVTDIAKMPHLLIAGATGSGKSVCINTLIMSIIFKADPEDVKLIMVDPKVVELSVYNGIPHLLLPVVTDPKKASGALNWAVAEMTDRYNKFAQYNVREIKGYNKKVESIKDIEDEDKPKKMPQIVIIIDELADLMMVAPGEVEDSICRLAQLARAAGIHLVIATQRPSVNVITGLIKANVPSRVAFAVSSGVDSRTIIDMNGAEKLLGKGDMLFYPAGYPKPMRVQGAFVSDSEVSKVVDFLTEQGMTADYNPEVENMIASAPAGGEIKGGGNDRDEYFVQAGKFIIEKDKASIGMLQRMFKIGFNRAARIMDQLAEAGVVGEEEGTKPRKVLMSLEEFDEILSQGY